MYLNRDNDTFILILQTMAFHILELRKVKFFVPGDINVINRRGLQVQTEVMHRLFQDLVLIHNHVTTTGTIEQHAT